MRCAIVVTGAGDRLAGVGEHDDGGLLGLRAGALVPVVGRSGAVAPSWVAPPVEEGDEPRAVVLGDEVADDGGQPVVLGELDAVRHVRADDGGALIWPVPSRRVGWASRRACFRRSSPAS